MPKRLTEAEVAHFCEQGFLPGIPLVSAAECAAFR